MRAREEKRYMRAREEKRGEREKKRDIGEREKKRGDLYLRDKRYFVSKPLQRYILQLVITYVCTLYSTRIYHLFSQIDSVLYCRGQDTNPRLLHGQAR